MALKTTNVNELKYYKSQLEKTKTLYEESIDGLTDTVKVTALYWQGIDGNNFRSNLYSLIGNDLSCITKELTAEIEYLNKLIIVLENAQEQIKSRLNG